MSSSDGKLREDECWRPCCCCCGLLMVLDKERLLVEDPTVLLVALFERRLVNGFKA